MVTTSATRKETSTVCQGGPVLRACATPPSATHPAILITGSAPVQTHAAASLVTRAQTAPGASPYQAVDMERAWTRHISASVKKDGLGSGVIGVSISDPSAANQAVVNLLSYQILLCSYILKYFF